MPIPKIEKILLGILIFFALILAIEVFLLYQKGYFASFFKKSVSEAPTPTEEVHKLPLTKETFSFGQDEFLGEYSGPDGISRAWLNAVIFAKPSFKEGKYYLSLSEEKDQTKPSLELVLGEPDRKIGFYIEKPAKVGEVRNWQSIEVNNLLGLLSPNSFAQIQLPTNIDKRKLDSIKNQESCDKQCLDSLTLIEQYLDENREFFKKLKEGAKIPKKTIIGPALQIIVIEN